MRLVNCSSCGKQHIGVSHEYAEEEIRIFNERYAIATPGEKRRLGGPAGLVDYLFCLVCGGSRFQPAVGLSLVDEALTEVIYDPYEEEIRIEACPPTNISVTQESTSSTSAGKPTPTSM